MSDDALTLSIVLSLRSQFLSEANGDPMQALLMACSALHKTALLVPTGLIQAGTPSDRPVKPPPPFIV